jgi:hypothetical protein
MLHAQWKMEGPCSKDGCCCFEWSVYAPWALIWAYGHYTTPNRQYGRLLASLISRVISYCTLHWKLETKFAFCNLPTHPQPLARHRAPPLPPAFILNQIQTDSATAITPSKSSFVRCESVPGSCPSHKRRRYTHSPTTTTTSAALT